MPSIVTAEQLRLVLGVSPSLYNDAYLNEVINTAEAVILPMLIANVSAVYEYKLENDIAYYYTQREHCFSIGQVVDITGLPAPFNISATLLEVGEYYFSADLIDDDVLLRKSVPAGVATLTGFSAVDIYTGNDAIESAILAVSVEVFQSRVAAGGQIEGLDFSATPYRMGRSLTNRVSTLLMPFLDSETICQ